MDNNKKQELEKEVASMAFTLYEKTKWGNLTEEDVKKNLGVTLNVSETSGVMKIIKEDEENRRKKYLIYLKEHIEEQIKDGSTDNFIKKYFNDLDFNKKFLLKSKIKEKLLEENDHEEFRYFLEELVEKGIDELLNKKKKNILLRVLGHLWTVVVNVFTIFVVLAIFNSAYDSFEKIVFSALTLIYLSVTGFAVGYGFIKEREMFALNKELRSIKKLLGENINNEQTKEEDREVEKRISKSNIKFGIGIGFNFIIYIIALLNLFSALS